MSRSPGSGKIAIDHPRTHDLGDLGPSLKRQVGSQGL